MKKIICFTLIAIVFFYLLPFIGSHYIDSRSGTGLSIMYLLIVSPLFSFFSGMYIAKKKREDWIYPIIIGLLFTSTVPIYYNSSALIYGAIYFVISNIGVIIGRVIREK